MSMSYVQSDLDTGETTNVTCVREALQVLWKRSSRSMCTDGRKRSTKQSTGKDCRI